MIKCNPSKIYTQLLNEMNTKNSNSNFANNFTDNFTNRFTDVEIKILETIKNEPTISQAKLSERIGVSKRTITNNMNNLQKRQIIERVGNNKSGYWKIQQ